LNILNRIKPDCNKWLLPYLSVKSHVMKTLILSVGLFFLSALAIAQDTQFYFMQTAGPRLLVDKDTSTSAFTGGFHRPRFGNIDLNFDNVMDLVVVDNINYRVLTFIGNGDKKNPDFQYAPEYEVYLPRLISWLIVEDFNGDGKDDIFCADDQGGIRVYKNMSSNKKLSFELYENKEALEHYDPDLNFFTPLYIARTDIPAVGDFDYDGDLDVMSFDVLGGNVTYYKNHSIEVYGHSDSFNYKVLTYCWGSFQESGETNDLEFGTSCFLFKKERHAGSNLLVLDLDADNDVDMLLSDVSYGSVVAAVNSRKDSTHHRDTISSSITSYPDNDVAIDVELFPSLNHVDIDFDGVKDLVCAPSFREGEFVVFNTWAYTNKGASNKPEFELLQKDFIQDKTIELGEFSDPAFFDYDADGDLDLFVAHPTPYTDFKLEESYYKLALYENIGSAKRAVFELKDNDYLKLSEKELLYFSPAFGDADNDGTVDLVLGTERGKLTLYTNANKPNEAADFSFSVNGYKSVQVSGRAQPCIADVNGDGKNDIILGGNSGQLSYYEWDTDSLILINDKWGGIRLGYVGSRLASPEWGDFDNDGEMELVVGDNQGYIYFYDDVNYADTGFARTDQILFNSLTGKTMHKDFGSFAHLASGDLNNDGLIDLSIGGRRGGLSYLSGIEQIINGVYNPGILSNVELYPNPSQGNFRVVLPNENDRAFIKIINLNGKILHEQHIISEQMIDCTDFANGHYLVMVFDEDGTLSTHKLMINQ